MYTKNTNNRINLSLSIAKKVQNKNALRALSSEGLEDILTTSKLSRDCVKNKVYHIWGSSLMMSHIVEIYELDVKSQEILALWSNGKQARSH